MKTLREVLVELVTAFTQRKIILPRHQAEELLCDLLQCPRVDLYWDENRVLTPEQYAICSVWLEQRLEGKPLAYLSGGGIFYGCPLEINQHVLIPRQETELLVDKVVHALQKQNLSGKVLWDLCCGSGCMAIALKKKFPALKVYATDCSAEALELARRNAARNEVEINLIRGDLLVPLQGQKAHYVVCNPPYISEQEYQSLEPDVRNYEPRTALVAGKTGLEIYVRLADTLPQHLYPHAQVWFEIGYQQGDAIQTIFHASNWKKHEVSRDWAGHPRFFFLENE